MHASAPRHVQRNQCLHWRLAGAQVEERSGESRHSRSANHRDFRNLDVTSPNARSFTRSKFGAWRYGDFDRVRRLDVQSVKPSGRTSGKDCIRRKGATPGGDYCQLVPAPTRSSSKTRAEPAPLPTLQRTCAKSCRARFVERERSSLQFCWNACGAWHDAKMSPRPLKLNPPC